MATPTPVNTIGADTTVVASRREYPAVTAATATPVHALSLTVRPDRARQEGMR
jgi:hypothetical protein